MKGIDNMKLIRKNNSVIMEVKTLKVNYSASPFLNFSFKIQDAFKVFLCLSKNKNQQHF